MSRRYYNATAQSFPEIQVGTIVAMQDQQTKLWDMYGIVTAIDPLWQYHIKIQRGHFWSNTDDLQGAEYKV